MSRVNIVVTGPKSLQKNKVINALLDEEYEVVAFDGGCSENIGAYAKTILLAAECIKGKRTKESTIVDLIKHALSNDRYYSIVAFSGNGRAITPKHKEKNDEDSEEDK